MSLNINLIQKNSLFSPKWERIHKIIKVVSYILLVLFIILSAAVGIGKITYKLKLDSYTSEIENYKQEIDKKKSIEGVYLSFARKVTKASEVTSGRLDPAKIYRAIKSISSPYARVTSLNVAGGKFAIKTRVDDISEVDNYIEAFLMDQELGVKSMTMGGITRTDKGDYTVDFTIDI